MNEHLISDLERFVDGRGVTMSEASGHVTLSIDRAHALLSVLVPRGVLEWWVEAKNVSNGSKVEDWCDYAGYDAIPVGQLSEEMRSDVVRFVEYAVVRPLRFAGKGRILEWHIGGE